MKSMMDDGSQYLQSHLVTTMAVGRLQLAKSKSKWQRT